VQGRVRLDRVYSVDWKPIEMGMSDYRYCVESLEIRDVSHSCIRLTLVIVTSHVIPNQMAELKACPESGPTPTQPPTTPSQRAIPILHRWLVLGMGCLSVDCTADTGVVTLP